MTESKRRELIDKLRAVVVSRGATVGEEAAARAAILRLNGLPVEPEPQQVEDDFAWLRGPNPLWQAMGASVHTAERVYQHAPNSQQRADSFSDFLNFILRQAGSGPIK